jgi:hypothetical protein
VKTSARQVCFASLFLLPLVFLKERLKVGVSGLYWLLLSEPGSAALRVQQSREQHDEARCGDH